MRAIQAWNNNSNFFSGQQTENRLQKAITTTIQPHWSSRHFESIFGIILHVTFWTNQRRCKWRQQYRWRKKMNPNKLKLSPFSSVGTVDTERFWESRCGEEVVGKALWKAIIKNNKVMPIQALKKFANVLNLWGTFIFSATAELTQNVEGWQLTNKQTWVLDATMSSGNQRWYRSWLLTFHSFFLSTTQFFLFLVDWLPLQKTAKTKLKNGYFCFWMSWHQH